VKAVMDYVLASIGLVLVSPLMALIVVAVKVDSPGPVFFRQERIGFGGRRFRMWKFRTMRVDAERVLRSNPALFQRYVSGNYKLPLYEDPRVSPLGHFLRRTSLDELPQLFNVLSGEMSLVGPRPVVPPEIAEYGDKAPIVLSAKPGMTGYWQVSGRSRVGYPERVDLDLYYVANWSLGLDLFILMRTMPAILLQRGAY
jgi:exopolysaccharide production protein ExoY